MPRSYGNLWPQITSWENLLHAYLDARTDKRFRDDVLRFTANLEENLANIQEHLLHKTWSPGRWREFTVREPKMRFIQAPPFRDRVVHHALVRVVEPLFERKFVHDTFACRKGKGTHEAAARLQSQLSRARAKWGDGVWVLKADISKYFPSVPHDVVFAQSCRTIRDKDARWLLWTILRGAGDGCRGLPVGALTSQLMANVHLDPFDHWVKDDNGLPFYCRYMDDWVVLLPDKADLQKVLTETETILNERFVLKLNPKTTIFPASHGVDFCGYRIWSTHMLPRKRNLKRTKKRFKTMARQYRKGQIDLDYVRPRVASFLGYVKHCRAWLTTESMLGRLVLRRG